MVISNLEYHDKGIITFTRKFDEGFGPSLLREIGWGCGYIGIPITSNLAYTFYDNIPLIQNQEWTYSQKDIINGKSYWVFGFDTAHAFMNLKNWSEEKVVSTINSFVPTMQGIIEKDILRSLYNDIIFFFKYNRYIRYWQLRYTLYKLKKRLK